MIEKWGNFFLIYIVFVFYNFILLNKLIEIGFDVNLKSSDEGKWIFLVLVVGSDIDEINDYN